MNRMVLLIDSDSARRERLREALFSKGLTALGSGNTEQGLHILVHNPLSLVIVAEDNWHLLSSFCQQATKRWPKTKIFVLVDHLPDELVSKQISHLQPQVSPADLVAAVNAALKEKSANSAVDLDMADFDDIITEAPVAAANPKADPGSAVPSFVDFGGGLSLEDILNSTGPASAQSPKATSSKTPTSKNKPMAFDFDIPVPPLKADVDNSVGAVEIDGSELELVIENEAPGVVEEAGPTQRLFFGGRPVDAEESGKPSTPVPDLAEEILQPIAEIEEDDLDEIGELLDFDVEPLPVPSNTSDEGQAYFEIDLSSAEIQGAPGAVWLMKIASTKQSGRLIVDSGPAQGTLYFAQGEGVWAEFKSGIPGLRDYLLQKDLPTPSGLNGEKNHEGEFLFNMVDNSVLMDDQVVEVILGLVRDRILKLAFEGWGDYRFEKDEVFSQIPPMMSVHPFGLILESRQKELAPAELIGLSSELEAEVLKPGPASGWVGNSLSRYLNNMDLNTFLEGRPTVGDFFVASSLGPITGTLIILALRDTQVVMTKQSS